MTSRLITLSCQLIPRTEQRELMEIFQLLKMLAIQRLGLKAIQGSK